MLDFLSSNTGQVADLDFNTFNGGGSSKPEENKEIDLIAMISNAPSQQPNQPVVDLNEIFASAPTTGQQA